VRWQICYRWRTDTGPKALAVGAVGVAAASRLLPEAAIAHLGDVVDVSLLELIWFRLPITYGML
jgi:hypothetical protein